MSLTVGQIIDDKYRIVRLLGEGGMGAVYEGENARIKRRVAIKVLHAATVESGDAVARFEREAQAAGQIGSDHILEVLDLGSLESGERYMVMEYLDGETLGQRIERLGRLTPQQLYPIAVQSLKGLGAAHRAGITHRDLKPDNIFILKEKAGQQDFVKIIDFGISKFQVLGDDSMKMTRTGAVLGTPYYMSPEQAKGDRTDGRSDLYSIGVILYEAVTGRVPFDANTFNELLFKIVLSQPPPAREVVPDLDPNFETIIARSMANDVAQRFQSSDEFIEALNTWAQTGMGVAAPADASYEDRVAAAVPRGARPHGMTANSWATQSGTAEPAPPKKSNAPLFAGLGVVAVLAVGGIATAVVLSGKSDQAAASTAPPAATTAATATPTAVAVTPPTTAASAAQPPAEAPPAADAKSAAKDPPAKTGSAPTRPTAGGTKPAATAATPAKPTSAPPKAGGTPDFGY
ncbi:MAG: serine/threonine protein kinase [Polyangiaceae bacterium]|nr:serine/threonine protein kinase [Polyangiaceae bacterium]